MQPTVSFTKPPHGVQINQNTAKPSIQSPFSAFNNPANLPSENAKDIHQVLTELLSRIDDTVIYQTPIHLTILNTTNKLTTLLNDPQHITHNDITQIVNEIAPNYAIIEPYIDNPNHDLYNNLKQLTPPNLSIHTTYKETITTSDYELTQSNTYECGMSILEKMLSTQSPHHNIQPINSKETISLAMILLTLLFFPIGTLSNPVFGLLYLGSIMSLSGSEIVRQGLPGLHHTIDGRYDD